MENMSSSLGVVKGRSRDGYDQGTLYTCIQFLKKIKNTHLHINVLFLKSLALHYRCSLEGQCVSKRI